LNGWAIAYVKDEGDNLSTMTIALIFVVSCVGVDNTICKDMLGACHV
jgi:hypothetical protein